ncbi:phytanoyl-CoA dioxygenase family protein [Streptomyces sp. DG2A-72]|uniref:phytanoyl-CoA dioxygenase family protein n=1 Tax=Streptomyces sp. DG2A-72 TaxID=3051386 RepID=UPI00265C6D4E|nr:phytanoyl-CoA dioxygenase family protein [Streptomyces sp. DG2A-72]MDO0936583.1 phytanoyl-CoA dioxygenase family protein [Streptomyces sp. DG2A-72]
MTRHARRQTETAEAPLQTHLPDDGLQGFRTDGYAVLPQRIAEGALEALRAEADGLIRRFTQDGFRSDDYWHFTPAGTHAPVLYRIHNLESQGSPTAARLYADEGPLHPMAASILGVPVRATACAMIVKLPGVAAPVPWHRDRTNVPPHTVCNLSVFLDDSDGGNGCLEFVPGSHLTSGAEEAEALQAQGPVRALPLAAGDVAVHDVRIAHASRRNTSPRIRRSIVIEFAPAELELP